MSYLKISRKRGMGAWTSQDNPWAPTPTTAAAAPDLTNLFDAAPAPAPKPSGPSAWSQIGSGIVGALKNLLPGQAPAAPAQTYYPPPSGGGGISTSTLLLAGAAIAGVFLLTKKR